MRRLVMAAAVTLAAAGCSSSGSLFSGADLASHPAGSSPKGPPADGGSYTTAQAILDELAKDKIPCTDPQPVANPTAPGALSMIDCFGGSTNDTVVTVFDTHDNALATARRILDLQQGLGGEPNWQITGVNWAINTVPEYAAKVLAALGGSRIQS